MAADEATAVILARIEGKLDRLIADNADHEHRLRAVETENANLRAELGQLKATMRGWLIGAGCAGLVGAGTGLTALFGG